MEIGAALGLLPPFVIAEVDLNGKRLVTLRTGESIGKEGHVVLKLGGGTDAIAAGQVQSYVPGGAFRTLFGRTAKCRFYSCDCYGMDGHGASTLPGGLQAGAGAVIAHAVGAPYDAGESLCVCGPALPKVAQRIHPGRCSVG